MAEAAAAAVALAPLSTIRETPTVSRSIRVDVSLETYFEIDRITEEIVMQFRKGEVEDGMFRVALQFPDELLDDSPEVCWLMEEHLTEKLPKGTSPFVFCLGDTTVGPCCPDEVAALHLQADVMVHYGHACLSPTGTLPVVYSFGRLEMNVTDAVQTLAREEPTMPERVLVLFEVGYHHAMEALELALKGCGVSEVVIGRIPQPTLKRKRLNSRSISSCCGDQKDSNQSCCLKEENTETTSTASPHSSEQENLAQANNAAIRCPLVVGGLELPDRIGSWDDLTDYTLIFVGECESTSKRQYVNVMLHFLSQTTPPRSYWTYSPKGNSLSTSVPVSLQKTLNRRFFLTQKARDANVFGILVSNLSQQHLVDVVKTLKARIHDAGKSSYSFAVGKINPAKLANFAEIECFVLVACREHSLLDDEREYPVPVITPLELEVALGTLEWGAQAYSLDCQDVLQMGTGTTLKRSSRMDSGEDDDAPYFSLVTGKYAQHASASEPQDLDLETLPGRGQVTAYKSEAATFLKQREYQGLQTQAGETEVKAAIVGQQGIASDYGGV